MTTLTDHLVVPGTRLCKDDERHSAGTGTYALHGFIYASLVGRVQLVQSETAKANKTCVVKVVGGVRDQNVVPAQGDIVTAKVLSVTPRSAKLNIVCVRDAVLTDTFRAQLRKEDVRATEKDRVEMYKSFRPGDIILARVISLGEAASGYLLSTAENELGVVIAHSAESMEADGTQARPMVPISWTEMQCPDTYVKEFRKIAKVCPANMVDLAKTED